MSRRGGDQVVAEGDGVAVTRVGRLLLLLLVVAVMVVVVMLLLLLLMVDQGIVSQSHRRLVSRVLLRRSLARQVREGSQGGVGRHLGSRRLATRSRGRRVDRRVKQVLMRMMMVMVRVTVLLLIQEVVRLNQQTRLLLLLLRSRGRVLMLMMMTRGSGVGRESSLRCPTSR